MSSLKLRPTIYPEFYHNLNYPQYGVSKDGRVVNLVTGKLLEVKQYERHNGKVYALLTARGDYRLVYIGRLLAEMFIPVPKELEGKALEVIHIDSDRNNTSLSNLKWAARGSSLNNSVLVKYEQIRNKWKVPQFGILQTGLYPNAIECEFKPGYYYVPNVTCALVCNKEGILFDLEENKPVKTRFTPHGYVDVGIRLDIPGKSKAHYKNVKLHRIVANLFCFKPKTRETLYVNHKDGNKTNNKASNLEWVTAKENLDHALRTGLYASKWVQARNIKTGKVLEFVSSRQAAEHFGIAESLLIKRLHNGKAAVTTFAWHVFRFKSDAPWPTLTEDEYKENTWKDDIATAKDRKVYVVKVRDVISGKSKVYPSLTQAANALGMSNSRLSYNFICFGDKITLEHYELEKLEEYKPEKRIRIHALDKP